MKVQLFPKQSWVWEFSILENPKDEFGIEVYFPYNFTDISSTKAALKFTL